MVALVRAVVLGVAAPVAMALVAPVLALSPLGGISLAYLVATVAIVTVLAVVPLDRLRSLVRGLAVVLAGIVLMALGFVLSRWGRGNTVTEVSAGVVGTAGVLLVGTAVGSMVGCRIAHPGHLTAVALASSAADIWSVHAPEGVTHALLQTPDRALQRLFSVSVPVPPSPVPDAVIGLGDVLFSALYLSATVRHGLPHGRTLIAVTAGLLLAGAGTLVVQRPLPALPFVGAMVVLLQARARAIARTDFFPTLVAALLVIAAIVRLGLQSRPAP